MKSIVVAISVISCWVLWLVPGLIKRRRLLIHGRQIRLIIRLFCGSIHWSVLERLHQGEKIQLKFRFKNTGNKPLFITNVRAGCGCTVPSYTKQAVAPDAEGEVLAAFDTNRSAAGDVRKTVIVHTNTRNGSEHSLIFTGHVKEVKVN